MVHYTCDLCGQTLGDQRFIVKLEILPAPENSTLTEADLDADHLEDLADLLDEADADEVETEVDPFSSHYQQFDLCAECRRQYLRDPLGRGARRRLKFSGN